HRVGAGIDQDVLADVRERVGGEQGVGVHRLVGDGVVEGGRAVDLRAVEVVDGVGVVPVGDLVGRVLVGEGGVQGGLVGHVEDRVHLQELVRVDRLPLAVEGQLGGGDAGGVEVAAAADQGLVLVDGLEVRHFRARLVGGHVGTGSEQGARVGVIVENAGGARPGARQVREGAGERVRWLGGRGVGVADAGILEFEDVGQVGGEVGVRDVGLVQPVY